MVKPLAGIRVVEVANWLAAPSAAALFADLGADVVKVEAPGGDVWRNFDLRSLGYDYDYPTNYAFELDNRGKRSIVVDLTKPGGPDVVQRMASQADIFITNLIQPRRQEYGLTDEILQGLNKTLIYVSFTGYGTEGVDAVRAGFDYAAFWARSGIMGLLGDPESPPPLCRAGQGDHVTALNIFGATLAALRMRDLTDEGQHVDVTLLETGAWTIGVDISAALAASDKQPPRHDRTRPANPIWNSYRCSDDRWVLLVMPVPDPYWPRFCGMVGKPEWLTDDRYNTFEGRWKNSAELTPQIEAIFAGVDSRTWWSRLDEAGVIWAPVAHMPEVVSDPTLRERSAFVPLEHPVFGTYETLAAPFKIRGVDSIPTKPAPLPGQHTTELLSEFGFSDDEVVDLAVSGVFG